MVSSEDELNLKYSHHLRGKDSQRIISKYVGECTPFSRRLQCVFITQVRWTQKELDKIQSL